MKELIGKIIYKLFVNEDQSILKFTTNEGDIYFKAQGDCCSESWFADILIDNPRYFFATQVISVEELHIPEWMNKLACKDNRTRQEYDEVYGFDIKTTAQRGEKFNCQIIFRNSSNGYYGGWCEYVENIRDDEHWEEITEDWRA